ncbi:hypothetical protein HON01_04360 [Candidatus Woesearchaeota archaeon]|jgi:hypothetical protein|nr:hypothetical protein [Candidatus Woesearchaeota archaeon]MBT7366658.1 hypothetical protein [Candidatus Woesearchaeota archaeon]
MYNILKIECETESEKNEVKNIAIQYRLDDVVGKANFVMRQLKYQSKPLIFKNSTIKDISYFVRDCNKLDGVKVTGSHTNSKMMHFFSLAKVYVTGKV